MTSRNFNQPYNPTQMVDKQIGDVYPTVRVVAQHLPHIVYLAENLDNLTPQDVEIRGNDATKALEWRYVTADNSGVWAELVPYEDISGPTLEMQAADGNLQYRPIGDPVWINLIPLKDISGKSSEMRSNANKLQWRLEGQATWTDLYDLNTVVNDTATAKAASDAATAQVAAVTARQSALEAGQSTSALYFSTKVLMDAVTGTANQGAFVTSDPGAGQYKWNGTAWEFLRPDTLAQKADKTEALLSSGNIQATASPRGEVSNGGVLINDANGRIIGFKIPNGQRGGSTYFAGDFPCAHLRSRRIKVVQKFAATTGFLGVPLGINPAIQVQSRTASVVATVTPISFTNAQVGNVLTQTAVFEVPATADYVGLVVLLFNGSPTTSDQQITLSSINYTMDSAPVGESTNDVALGLRLDPMQAQIDANTVGVSANRLTSGQLINDAQPRGQAFNGALITNFADGRIGGFTVPAGQQGGSTYLVGDIPVASVRGKRIKLVQKFTATAGFLTAMSVNPALDCQSRKGTTVTALASTGKTTKQVGSVITQEATVDVPADADFVGVGIQLFNAAVALVNQSITLESVTYSLLTVDPNETLSDSVLTIRLNEAIRKLQDNSSTAEYQATVTVKPTGGDYTHPKLALDAIIDASDKKKYRIAIYPGVYSGYAEWHLKDYVDLVGIGRREEIIIAYSNADNASAATIRGTSVFWAARRSNVKNLTVQIKNGRYAIHAESDGQRPGNEFGIYNCVVRHLGNASAINNDWAIGSQYAVGSGNSPGELFVLRGSHFEGPGGGFSYHTPGFGMPISSLYMDATMVDVEGCSFKCTVAGNASFAIKPIRPGAGDWCRLVGNKFEGKVLYATNEWVSPDTTTNRAQIHVYGHGNTGMDFQTNVTGPVNTYTPAFT